MTVYYVDTARPDDTGAGTSEATAWKTVAKVNSTILAAGDQVLFKRDQTFYGGKLKLAQSGTAGNLITISAYGTGAKPIIDCSLETPVWTLHAGSIYKLTLASNPEQIIVDGMRMPTMAGAIPVAANSWYWAAGTLYVWLTANANPGSKVMKIPNDWQCLRPDVAGIGYWLIEHLSFKYSSNHGIDVNGSVVGAHHLTVNDCESSWNARQGVGFANLANLTGGDITFTDCESHHNIGEGMWLGLGTRLIATRPNIHDNGDPTGSYVFSGMGGGILVGPKAVDCVVDGGTYANNVNNPAIRVEVQTLGGGVADWPIRTIVKNNTIDHAVNGAALIIEGTDTLVSRNRVVNTVGNCVQVGVILAEQAANPKFYNNFFKGAGAAYCFEGQFATNITSENNIIEGATNTMGIKTDATAGYVGNNNIFSGAESFRWVSTYPNFATWKASRDTTSFFNAHGLVAPDYRATVGTYPVDKGKVIAGITDGYKRTFPDIGWKEYVPTKTHGRFGFALRSGVG